MLGPCLCLRGSGLLAIGPLDDRFGWLRICWLHLRSPRPSSDLRLRWSGGAASSKKITRYQCHRGDRAERPGQCRKPASRKSLQCSEARWLHRLLVAGICAEGIVEPDVKTLLDAPPLGLPHG